MSAATRPADGRAMKRSAWLVFISIAGRSSGLRARSAQIDGELGPDALGDVVGGAVLGIALCRNGGVKKGRRRNIIGRERRYIPALDRIGARPGNQVVMRRQGVVVARDRGVGLE